MQNALVHEVNPPTIPESTKQAAPGLKETNPERIPPNPLPAFGK